MKTSYILFLSILFIGCASTQNKNGNLAQQKKLDSWLNQKNFEVISTAAKPTSNMNLNAALLANNSSGNHVTLVDNPNYVKFKGDSIFVRLPYFGTRTGAGGYGTENSIAFDGLTSNYSAKYNAKKKAHIIDFEFVTNKRELYNLQLTLYGNLSTYLSLNSSNRSPISYTGHVKELK
jgi:hypothetical protein